MTIAQTSRRFKARLTRWMRPGIKIKRWLALGLFGILVTAVGLNHALNHLLHPYGAELSIIQTILVFGLGLFCIGSAGYGLFHTLTSPYRDIQQRPVAEVLYTHSRRRRGMKVVAIGGGSGLPSVLRAVKPYTGNITAVVTVADDGGSSGRLRRDMGVLPPGDLRNNIAALADDESLMTRLFQYRFNQGDLKGHAFGNLFIAALTGIAGSLEQALVETERVLNIQGRVLPSTLRDVQLVANVQLPDTHEMTRIVGESNIPVNGGRIEHVRLEPPNIEAYEESVRAILDADIVIIGPGSLFTSILPNLLVKGIAEALRATPAYKVYICNVATQPGETEGFTVAEHVMALERHIGRGVFQTVVANNVFPVENAGKNTVYVQTVSPHHEIAQRYEVVYTDLADHQQPWRHDSRKLAEIILTLRGKIVEKAAAAV
jgi:uncharacterized cofD-like protein